MLFLTKDGLSSVLTDSVIHYLTSLNRKVSFEKYSKSSISTLTVIINYVLFAVLLRGFKDLPDR